MGSALLIIFILVMNNNTQSPIAALQGSLVAASTNSTSFKTEQKLVDEVKPARSLDSPIKMTIVRYDFDSDVPTKRYVGFRLQNTRNGKVDYTEAEIPIIDTDGKSETEILDMAYFIVKDRVDAFKLKTNNLLGSEYIPPSEA